MTHNETITDIIRKIRAEADYIEETARGSFKAGENYDGIAYTESDLESALYLAETKRKKANRLEAALKRVREELEAKIADLQARVKLWTDRSAELVEACNKHYANANRCATTEKSSAVGDCAKLREALGKILWCLEWMFNNTDDKSVQSHLGEPIALAKAALAEPERNCDRFATVKDAAIAFALERQDAPNPCPDFTFSAWLLTPATEKDGGSK